MRGDAQAEQLRLLASPAGRGEFQAWAVAPGRTVLEAMQEFPSARPPLGKPVPVSRNSELRYTIVTSTSSKPHQSRGAPPSASGEKVKMCISVDMNSCLHLVHWCENR